MKPFIMFEFDSSTKLFDAYYEATYLIEVIDKKQDYVDICERVEVERKFSLAKNQIWPGSDPDTFA